MCNRIIVCEDAVINANDTNTCDGTIRIFKLTKNDDYKIIAVCTKHAEQRGYQSVPQQLDRNDEAAKPHYITAQTCADVELKENPYGKNPDGLPECAFSLNPFKWRQANQDELHVFYLPTENLHVALCSHHAHGRGYLDHPRMYSKEEGAQAYTTYHFKAERDATFVQVYHPELLCVYNKDKCTKDEVAEYYFSDGSTLPICTFHLPDSDALQFSKSGHWMSKEYYTEVYNKK